MTTKVRCRTCGLIIESTTVIAESYKQNEIIDTGCPYCGHGAPLEAVSAKNKPKKTKEEPEPLPVEDEDKDEE